MKKMLLRLSTLSIGLGLLIAFGTSTAFAGTTPAITNIDHKNGVNRVLVEFNAPVWSDTAYTTALAASDFQLGGTCGATSISSVTHAAGDDWAVLVVAGTIAANESTCTIAAVANNIFTVGGALSEKTLAWDGSADATPPTISSATALNGQAEVLVTFSEHVYGEANGTADLVNADLAYDDVAGGTDADACTGTAAGTTAHTAGNNWAVWTCSVALTTAADIDDNEDMDLAGATSVYDVFGNAAIAAQNANLAADAGVPAFATGFVATKAEANVGNTKILVKFSEPVFNAAAPTMAADLATTDFTYTNTSGAGAASISAVSQTTDQKWALLTVNTALLEADLTNATADTVNAVATEIHDTFDQQQATTTMQLADNTDPTILSLAFNQSTSANIFTITYSEKVTITGLTTASATMAASTATVGDLAAAGALQGFGAFATTGNVTVPTTLNSLAIDSTQTIITVTIAGGTNGYMASTSTTAPSGVFTPEITGAGIQDLRPSADTANDIEITSTLSTLTTTLAWDLTKPTVLSALLTDSYLNGNASTAGSDGKVDKLVVTTSETLKTVASSADTINDWTLTSGATEFGTGMVITSASAPGSAATYILIFSDANIYYDTATFTLAAAANEWSMMDRAGNILPPTGKICMSGYVCVDGTVNYAVTVLSIEKPKGGDTTAPGKPTDVKATQTTEGYVKLTWTDPTATDLSKVNIYRSKNGQIITGDIYASVAKGAATYTDKNVIAGDKVEYMLKSVDSSNNVSGLTDVVAITVTAVETTTTTDTTTTTTDTTTETSDDTGTSDIEKDTGPVDDTADDDDDTGTSDIEKDTGPVDDAADDDDDTAEKTPKKEKKVELKDISKHWAKKEIEAMVDKGIIQGHKDGSFKPDNKLNRAEGAILLCRVLGIDEKTEAKNKPAKDVEAKAWFGGCVGELAGMKIVKGGTDVNFRPGDNINRVEFLKLVMLAYVEILDDDEKTEVENLMKGTVTKAFSDLDSKAWYAGVVTAAKEKGFLKGKACGKNMCVDAGSNITRAEAATILYRVFNDLL